MCWSGKKWGQKGSTGQRFICIEVTSYKIHTLDVLTEIFESWRFIANTTGKKVLFLNEYSNVFYQNPQSELFKVCMAFRCVDRDSWELKVYYKNYRQKGFIFQWIFIIVLSKSTTCCCLSVSITQQMLS